MLVDTDRHAFDRLAVGVNDDSCDSLSQCTQGESFQFGLENLFVKVRVVDHHPLSIESPVESGNILAPQIPELPSGGQPPTVFAAAVVAGREPGRFTVWEEMLVS